MLFALCLWTLYKLGGNRLSLFKSLRSQPTVNVVIAATANADYSWTARLSLSADFQALPYIADNPNATYHPVRNKGREAMIILTYLHDFYDDLPDISIFTHADDKAWHNEAVCKLDYVFP